MTVSVEVRVQEHEFDTGAEFGLLRADNHSDGATTIFVGSVRDFTSGDPVTALALEYYPGMTEKVLADIGQRALERWSLGRVRILHRVGQLVPGDDIVFVGVTAPHRQSALDACGYIIDLLKTEAPFWKKESGSGRARWVESRASDHEALEKWR